MMSSTENTLDRPFGELMDKLGITQEQIDAIAAENAAELASREVFMAHAAFESQTDAEGRTRYADPTSCEGQLRILEESGHLWPLVCDGCGFEVSVAIAKFDPVRLLERRLARCGVPSEFAGKAFDKGDPEQEPTLGACRLWLRQFRRTHLADSIPAVGLWSKPGRGKTHLLSLMIETLVRGGTDALYRSTTGMFDELREGLDCGAYEIRWQRLLKVPVLALDDLGAGRWTEWQAERFAELVDHRYGKALPLLVATNIPPAGWDARFGDRTSSRLRGMCLRFELAGPDRRDPPQRSLLEPPAAS